MNNVDVVIVGLGPTGMTLAHELEKHNISYLVCDKRDAVSTMTRAVNITPASIAVLRMSLGLGLDGLMTKTQDIKLFFNNNKVSSISYKELNFPYKHFCYLPQPKLESLLKQNLNVESLKEKTLVKEVSREGQGYKVLLKDLANDEECWVTCQYVIGCDGSNSIVSNAIHTSEEKEDYQTSFLLFDIELEETFTNESLYYVDDDSYIIVVPTSNKNYRVILSFPSINKMDIESYRDVGFLASHLEAKINQALPNITKLVWFTCGDFKHRITHVLDTAKSFLCGDAFHIFSPIGGLNLNTGLQDAVNLGWKLAYVINGHATDKLLESYQTERTLAANRIRDKTKKMTKCMVHAKEYAVSNNFTATSDHEKQILLSKLSYALSGYDNYAHDNSGPPINKVNKHHHISEFVSSQSDYEELCRRLLTNSFNLIISSHLDTDSEMPHPCLEIISFDCCLTKENEAVLIRPDGYVLYVGKIATVSEVNKLVEHELSQGEQ